MKLPSRPAFRFVSVTGSRIIGVRRIIGVDGPIGHAAPYQAPAVVRYPLHDLSAARIAPADMGSVRTAGISRHRSRNSL